MWGGECGRSCRKPHEWEQSLNVLDAGFSCTEKADQRLEKMTVRHLDSSECSAHQKQTDKEVT